MTTVTTYPTTHLKLAKELDRPTSTIYTWCKQLNYNRYSINKEDAEFLRMMSKNNKRCPRKRDNTAEQPLYWQDVKPEPKPAQPSPIVCNAWRAYLEACRGTGSSVNADVLEYLIDEEAQR